MSKFIRMAAWGVAAAIIAGLWLDVPWLPSAIGSAAWLASASDKQRESYFDGLSLHHLCGLRASEPDLYGDRPTIETQRRNALLRRGLPADYCHAPTIRP